MRAPVVGDDVRELERAVELQPVRAAQHDAVKAGDGEVRDARIVEPHVAVEAGNAEIGASRGQAVHLEGIQRVLGHGVVPIRKSFSRFGVIVCVYAPR